MRLDSNSAALQVDNMFVADHLELYCSELGQGIAVFATLQVVAASCSIAMHWIGLCALRATVTLFTEFAAIWGNEAGHREERKSGVSETSFARTARTLAASQ
jgi:hypothetical protein